MVSKYMRNQEEKEKNMDCTVLVTSCYSYKDVLENFEILFQKYWGDCPYVLFGFKNFLSKTG